MAHAADFEQAVRARAAEQTGPCVLDVCESNMKNFSGFSSSRLAEADLRSNLPQHHADAVLAALEQQHNISAAFGVRRELVNFKKVCLHVLQDAMRLEKELRLCATYFFADLVNPSSLQERSRYIMVNHELCYCRGGLVAMQDAREFTKMICALPRHPAAVHEQGDGLVQLPGSLGLHRMLSKACLFLEQPIPEFSRLQQLGPHEGASQLVSTIQQQLPELPDYECSYIGKVCIARGVCKAVRAKGQLAQLITAIAQCIQHLRLVLDQLASYPLDPNQVKQGMHHRMHTDLVSCAIPVAEEVLVWLNAIQTPSESSVQLFVASDAGHFVPNNCRLTSAFDRSRAAVSELRIEIENAPWPPVGKVSAARTQGKHKCATCSGTFSRAFVSRSVCWRCELHDRGAGRCPFGCGSSMFCAHAGRCVVCDQWSCDECELHVGDGELVQALVQRQRPAVVFLDFDQTLCSTRNGECPVIGKHCLDTQLQAVAAEHHNVVVVTRNSHTEQISAMLAAAGLASIQVMSVGTRKGTDKAGVLNDMELWRAERGEQNGFEPTAIFVDDDIRELTFDAVVALSPRLKRVLFRR